MSVDLSFKTLGQGPPLIILHGLFGSSDNWFSIANKLKDKFTIYLVDQRNHGASPHDSIHNYEEMSSDLLKLCEKESLTSVNIIGHSMGGKAAMKFATTNPKLINKLVVVDISPKQYPLHHQQILDAFYSVDISNISSRNEADSQMSSIIDDSMVRQFLLKNLKRNEDKSFSWKINLDSLNAQIENIGESLNESEKFYGETLFISGSKSGYITEGDENLIEHHFPQSVIRKIECGHWVHAEAPTEFLNITNNFLE